ncbi:MAG: alpha/beta hydrolase [Alphaproteobacteria bacterium]|nr:alpha/beta hydrolase [Alphaproteobacteria bacterium]
MQASLRKRLEYLQRSPQSGPAEQVVVLLHGYGRNAALMQKMADEVAARLPRALIVMPQAPEIFEAPASDEGNALKVPRQLRVDDSDEGDNGLRRQWFSIRAATFDEMRHQLMQVAQQVNEFLSEVLDQNGLSESDAALMGFSQGGAVALYTAYYRPTPVKCVVGHSTLFMGGHHFLSQPPTLYVYGLDDEEFARPHFEDAARQLSVHIPDITVKALAGLRHTTNAQSRAVVADYMARHLKQPL